MMMMTTLPAITHGLIPLRKPALGAGAGAACGAATGAADELAGAAAWENKGAGAAAGAFDCGTGTPTAGAEATGGACIIRVKSPGPAATGGAALCCCGGGGGALKNAVAPSGLESALGFMAPPPDDSGPADGGATSGEADGALPDPKPGRLSSENRSPPRDCGRMDGALRPWPDNEGPYICPSLKVGVPILGPEIWPEAEMEGPLIPLIPAEGAWKLGPLTDGF